MSQKKQPVLIDASELPPLEDHDMRTIVTAKIEARRDKTDKEDCLRVDVDWEDSELNDQSRDHFMKLLRSQLMDVTTRVVRAAKAGDDDEVPGKRP
jgi:hypothetical protein